MGKIEIKKIALFSASVALFILFVACKNGGKEEMMLTKDAVTLDKDASYAFGMALASQFKEDGFRFEYKDFVQGFQDFLEDKKLRIAVEDAKVKVQTAYQEAFNVRNEPLKQKEAEFLAENAKKSGIQITPSGLQYEAVSQGIGAKPLDSDMVRVHYEGRLVDGTVFDSSYERGKPEEFALNRVIPGWAEGLQLMNSGGMFMFYIPSNLAYGESGTEAIPPYAPLIFKVELLDVIKK